VWRPHHGEPANAGAATGVVTAFATRHALSFHPVEAPTVASEVVANGDPRPPSFALGTWHWTVHEGVP